MDLQCLAVPMSRVATPGTGSMGAPLRSLGRAWISTANAWLCMSWYAGRVSECKRRRDVTPVPGCAPTEG